MLMGLGICGVERTDVVRPFLRPPFRLLPRARVVLHDGLVLLVDRRGAGGLGHVQRLERADGSDGRETLNRLSRLEKAVKFPYVLVDERQPLGQRVGDDQVHAGDVVL